MLSILDSSAACPCRPINYISTSTRISIYAHVLAPLSLAVAYIACRATSKRQTTFIPLWRTSLRRNQISCVFSHFFVFLFFPLSSVIIAHFFVYSGFFRLLFACAYIRATSADWSLFAEPDRDLCACASSNTGADTSSTPRRPARITGYARTRLLHYSYFFYNFHRCLW